MRLIPKLFLGTKKAELVDYKVTMELSGHGRATFRIKSEEEPELSIARFFLSFQDQKPNEVMTGFTSKIKLIKPSIYEIIVREFSFVLELPTPLMLRHPSAMEMLTEISKTRKVEIVTHKDAQNNKAKVPYLYNLGSARDAMEKFNLFGVQGGFWVTLPGRKIFWGTFCQSPFAKMKPITLNDQLITEIDTLDNSFEIPTIPALRAGMRWQDQVITRLDIDNNKTRVVCAELS